MQLDCLQYSWPPDWLLPEGLTVVFLEGLTVVFLFSFFFFRNMHAPGWWLLANLCQMTTNRQPLKVTLQQHDSYLSFAAPKIRHPEFFSVGEKKT